MRCASLLIALLPGVSPLVAEEPGRVPNVLFISIDDLRPESLRERQENRRRDKRVRGPSTESAELADDPKDYLVENLRDRPGCGRAGG